MIFWWSAAYLGAMLAHLGAMLAYLEAMWAHLGAMLAYLEGNVGPSWGQCGPILGLSWPSLGLSWPILGLCWPILGLCWPILRLIFAHAEPSWATRSEKWEKKENSKIHCKTQDILATRGLRRLGRRPLSYTERRELPYGNATARGPLARLPMRCGQTVEFQHWTSKSNGFWLSFKSIFDAKTGELMMEDSQGTSMYTNFFTSIYKHTPHTHIYIHTHVYFSVLTRHVYSRYMHKVASHQL